MGIAGASVGLLTAGGAVGPRVEPAVEPRLFAGHRVFKTLASARADAGVDAAAWFAAVGRALVMGLEQPLAFAE